MKKMNTEKMWQWEERGRMAWVAWLLMQTKNKTEQMYKKFYIFLPLPFVGLIVRLVGKKTPKSQKRE